MHTVRNCLTFVHEIILHGLKCRLKLINKHLLRLISSIKVRIRLMSFILPFWQSLYNSCSNNCKKFQTEISLSYQHIFLYLDVSCVNTIKYVFNIIFYTF